MGGEQAHACEHEHKVGLRGARSAGRGARRCRSADARLVECLPSLPSPKRVASHFEWYPYYAGFSLEFAEAVLGALGLRRGSIVLDPWAGAATTGVAALRLGYQASMLDVSPAMALVARAHMLLACGADPVDVVRRLIASLGRDLPLAAQLAIWGSALVPDGVVADWRSALPRLSDDDTIACAAVMSVLRSRARAAVGSNPTWLNTTAVEMLEDKADTALAFELGTAAQMMRAFSAAAGRPRLREFAAICADSRETGFADASIDCVLTSPPYCTRIDYAILTRPELEFLGVTGPAFSALRRRMMGTPMMLESEDQLVSTSSVASLLSSIKQHPSYASAGYYARFFRQYFASLEASLREIGRVLRPLGYAALVVQPSDYKDVFVDLPGLVGDIAITCGLSVIGVRTWPARDMRHMNTVSRRYRAERQLRESLVLLRRA